MVVVVTTSTSTSCNCDGWRGRGRGVGGHCRRQRQLTTFWSAGRRHFNAGGLGGGSVRWSDHCCTTVPVIRHHGWSWSVWVIRRQKTKWKWAFRCSDWRAGGGGGGKMNTTTNQCNQELNAATYKFASLQRVVAHRTVNWIYGAFNVGQSAYAAANDVGGGGGGVGRQVTVNTNTGTGTSTNQRNGGGTFTLLLFFLFTQIPRFEWQCRRMALQKAFYIPRWCLKQQQQ